MGRHEKVTDRAPRPALAALAGGVAALLGVLLVTAVPPANGAASSTSRTPIADAYVDGNVPTANYGSLTRLRVDTSPVVRSYLRFDLSGVTGTVTRALLDLTPTSNLTAGVDVRGVGGTGSWTETGLTFDTSPPVGAVVATSGALTAGTVVSLDVTGLVQPGLLEVALTGRSSTALSLASRESSTPPVLRVDTVDNPAPHNTALPSVTGTAQASKTVAADPGTWEGAAPLTYTYQWQRCDASGGGCVVLSGATSSSYKLTVGDVGATMRVAVTATNSAGTATATSGPSAVVLAPAPPAGDKVLLAAGDIACSATSSGALCQERATSDVIMAQNPDVVLPLGDVQYECGDLVDFQSNYDPTWGRALVKTRPVVGNHEYNTSTDSTANCYNRPAGAPGYYGYFGDLGSPSEPGCRVSCKGYYSYDVGDWHVVALNSNCSKVGGCNAGDPQVVWLQNDLAAHADQCTLVYYHHPRWTSGQVLPSPGMSTVVSTMYAAGVDVVLNGHDHDYERFAPLDPSGAVDPVRGYRQFVVGTGGRNLSSFITNAPGSEVRDSSSFGLLKMVLSQHSYTWEFVPVAGSGAFRDTGSQPCHSTPLVDSTAPSAPAGLAGTAAGSRADLDWTPATDNVGVVAHRVYRDGSLLATIGNPSGYADPTAGAASTHSYTVSAIDAGGNESPRSAAVTVTTGPAPAVAPLLVDGFESGGLTAWTTVNGVSPQQAVVGSGAWAARSTVNAGGPSYVYTAFPAEQNELWVNERFQLLSQSTTLSLLRLRTASGSSLVTVQLSATGQLSYVNETTGVTTTSSAVVAPGGWHTLGLHAVVGSPGRVELSLDGVPVLSGDESLGTVGFGRAQFGDTGSSHVGDQVFDDVYVGTTPATAPPPPPPPAPAPAPVTAFAAATGSDGTSRMRALSTTELDAVRAADSGAFTTTGTWGGSTVATNRNLSGVACVDAWTCWAVGQKGAAITTGDGGRSWSSQATTTSQDLEAVAFADTGSGLSVGKRGTIVRTTNGGASWQVVTSGTTVDLLAVSWLDSLKAVAVGARGTIVTSGDGGLSWSVRSSGTISELRAVAAVDSTRLVAVGRAGTVLRSGTSGVTWTASKVGTRDLGGVSARGNIVVAVGAAGATLASDDAGATWLVGASGTAELTDVSLTDGGRAWASGRTGVVLTTTDNGRTWSPQSSATGADLFAIAASDLHRALVVGSTATVRTTVDSGVTWTQQPPAFVEWGFGAASSTVSTVSLALAYSGSGTLAAGSTASVLASVDGVSWTAYPVPLPTTSATATTVDLTALVAGNATRLAGLRVRVVVSTSPGSTLRTDHDLVRLDVTS